MLKSLLQAMLIEAYQKLKTPVKRKLKGNLHVAIAVTEKNVHLALARDKTYPSAEEWKTTLANFPYHVPQVAPTSFIDSDRRFAMRAKLPRREDVPQQLALSDPATGESEPESDEINQE